MPNYSNSYAPRRTPQCSECTHPECNGPDELRHFYNWNDLASHLSEGVIVEYVNRLHTIAAEYERLKKQDDDRKYAATQRARTNKALLEHARKMLSPEQIRQLSSGEKPVVVTIPMKSRRQHHE